MSGMGKLGRYEGRRTTGSDNGADGQYPNMSPDADGRYRRGMTFTRYGRIILEHKPGGTPQSIWFT